MRVAAALALAGLLGAAALSGCGGPAGATVRGTPGAKIVALSPPGMPSQLGGLAVTREDIGPSLAATGRAYIDGAALFGLRSATTLEATVQFTRFGRGAPVASPAFRESVVDRVGSTTPVPYRLGPDTVYFTTGPSQNIAVWFRGRYLMVLSVRQDYPRGRALLRLALGLQP